MPALEGLVWLRTDVGSAGKPPVSQGQRLPASSQGAGAGPSHGTALLWTTARGHPDGLRASVCQGLDKRFCA